jgi:hypothetical protein
MAKAEAVGSEGAGFRKSDDLTDQDWGFGSIGGITIRPDAMLEFSQLTLLHATTSSW